jgi:hypothetical protein
MTTDETSSDCKASFITGSTLTINGGQHMYQQLCQINQGSYFASSWGSELNV